MGSLFHAINKIENVSFGYQLQGDTIIGLGLYGRSENKTSLPESIMMLKSLKYLSLGKNDLKTLPESIGNLKSLQVLWLGQNELITLPESIGNLTSLQTLELWGNKLTTLPESIGNLKSLTSLNLIGNQLSFLPESVTKLESLQKLDFSQNGLTTLPESIGNLKSLTYLHLGLNKLTTLPESIGNLTSLQDLTLQNNEITTLPEAFSHLINLKKIILSNNKWIGEWADMAKNDIPSILKLSRSLNGLNLFISHAWEDQDKYRVKEFKRNLGPINIVHNVYICEDDVIDNIQEFMDANVPKSHLLLFIATKNSLSSKACRYELYLAGKNNIPILPIKGDDISWSELRKIDLGEFNHSNLDLSTPKETFELTISNFDSLCKMLQDYIKNHETELKKIKQNSEKIESVKRIILDSINSKELKEIIKNNLELLGKIFQELNSTQITDFEYFLKLGQILRQK